MSSPERLPDLSGRRTCQQNYIFRGDPGVLLGWHGVDTGRLSRLCERFLRQAVTRARLSAVLGDGDQFLPDPGILQRLCLAAGVDVPPEASFCLFFLGRSE